jgi:hypothetical protein
VLGDRAGAPLIEVAHRRDRNAGLLAQNGEVVFHNRAGADEADPQRLG